MSALSLLGREISPGGDPFFNVAHQPAYRVGTQSNWLGEITTLAQTITSKELAELPTERLLQRLFNEFLVRIHEPRELSYRCTCSRKKSDQTLRVFQSRELEEILEEEGVIKVDCEFCGAQYRYDAVDVAALPHDPVPPAPAQPH